MKAPKGRHILLAMDLCRPFGASIKDWIHTPGLHPGLYQHSAPLGLLRFHDKFLIPNNSFLIGNSFVVPSLIL